MARRPAVLAVLAIPLLLLVGPTPRVPPAGAQDAEIAIDGEPCTDGVGVTVVIDFQELGDDTVLVRCAPDGPGDGFAALDQAEVPYRTATSFPGFLCRIADRPDDDPCTTASPASAYWSYWLAPAGGDWCYSNRGAANRTPPPGAVEGWSFALDRTEDEVPPPRFAPPDPPDGVTPQPLADDDCTTAAASGSVEGADAGPTTVGQGGPVDLDAEPASSGSPIGVVVSVAAVAALVAVAVVVARRRRTRPVGGTDADVDAEVGTDPSAEDIWRAPETATEATPVRARPGDAGRDAPDPEGDGWSGVFAHRPSEDDATWAPPDREASP